jgi:hypothetical protein
LLIDAIKETIALRTSAFDTADEEAFTVYATVWLVCELLREFTSGTETTAWKSPSVDPTTNW